MNDTSDNQSREIEVGTAPIPFAEFLESIPPGQVKLVSDCIEQKDTSGNAHYEISIPPIQLYCPSETCNGLRFFRFVDGNRILGADKKLSTFAKYICSNCRRTTKMFSLYIDTEVNGRANCYKFGELPAFGPSVPPGLVRLFGKERETFLNGRRCETQALGIGAFVYYRRVVENQKNQILDEIIRLSEILETTPAASIEKLKGARNEAQFVKAMDLVKDALPQSLLISGRNPLTLLQSALSRELHTETDESCLDLAKAVRIVLVELADRLGQALKDEAELTAAVNRLVEARKGRSGAV